MSSYNVGPHTFSTAEGLHWRQLLSSNTELTLQAILGDLQHKTDVYIYFNSYDSDVTWRFSNEAQGSYLKRFERDLVPPPAQPGQPPSDHTLGTIFEYHYYTSPGFRSRYVNRLNSGQRQRCLAGY